MKQIQSKQSLQLFHQQLETIKTSIDALIKQENEYEQNWRRYSSKEFELKQKEGEHHKKQLIEQKRFLIKCMMQKIETN